MNTGTRRHVVALARSMRRNSIGRTEAGFRYVAHLGVTRIECAGRLGLRRSHPQAHEPVNLLSASGKPPTMGTVLMGYLRETSFAHLWLRSLPPVHSPPNDGLSWITFRAISWLQSYLKPEIRVFEYGAVGSMLFLAKSIGELVSVERDQMFHSPVADCLAELEIQNSGPGLCCSESWLQTELSK